MKITRKQLRLWGACYNDKRIAELVPEAGLTPLEVAALDIPATDRLWVLLREEVIPARELRLLVCDWAESACRRTGWNDERSLAAIAVARRFAFGEVSAAELAEAELEARSAAWSASRAAWSASRAAWSAARAAWLAAWSAACSASGESDWAASAAAAAEAAARSSAEAARTSAADAAEAAEEQIADVVRVLKG